METGALFTVRRNLPVAALVTFMVFGAGASYAQELSGPPANPNLKYSTPIPPGVAAPSELETPFGTLKLFDGVPDQASTEKIYDNLDFQRAVQAYLLGLPPVNQLANRRAILQMGLANTTVPIWEDLVEP